MLCLKVHDGDSCAYLRQENIYISLAIGSEIDTVMCRQLCSNFAAKKTTASETILKRRVFGSSNLAQHVFAEGAVWLLA